MAVGSVPRRAELRHVFFIWLLISSDAGVTAARQATFNAVVLDDAVAKSAVQMPVGHLLLRALYFGQHIAQPGQLEELLPHRMVERGQLPMVSSDAGVTAAREVLFNVEVLDNDVAKSAELYAQRVLGQKLAVKLARFWDQEVEGVTNPLHPMVEKHGLEGLAQKFGTFLKKNELAREAAKAGTFQRALGDSLAAFWMKHYAQPSEKALYIMGRAVMLMEDEALPIEVALVAVGEELLGYWFPVHDTHRRTQVVEELAKLKPTRQVASVAKKAADSWRLLSVRTMFVALAARGDCSLSKLRLPAITSADVYEDFKRQRIVEQPKSLLAQLALLEGDMQKVTLADLALSHVQCNGLKAAAKWDSLGDLEKQFHDALRHN